MKYILDTHVFLWWLSDDKQLSQAIRDSISDSQNLVFVSTVSLWEIEIKKSLGKLVTPTIDEKVLKECNFVELPIMMTHVQYLPRLPLIHADPFDRLLICQSLVENAELLTNYATVKKYFSQKRVKFP